jgi:t-SNARE complex subunit (syntaxin)
VLQAVEATLNLEKGNASLRKAIDYNKAARMYVLFLLLAATFGILFLDWWYSGRARKH